MPVGVFVFIDIFIIFQYNNLRYASLIFYANRIVSVRCNMEKKTDLRILKTRKGIQESFLALRAKMPLEKIKVRDLCRLAMINPATFYHHYTDVFALSEEMENAAIARCFEKFEYKDCLFSDPQSFAMNIPSSLEADPQLLSVLFRGRMDVLYTKLEKQLLDYYRSPEQSPKDDIKLIFTICGAMQTMQLLKSSSQYSHEVVSREMEDIIKKLW